MHADAALARRLERPRPKCPRLQRRARLGDPGNWRRMRHLRGQPALRLTQAVGLGLNGPAEEDELDRIEALFSQPGGQSFDRPVPPGGPELAGRAERARLPASRLQ